MLLYGSILPALVFISPLLNIPQGIGHRLARIVDIRQIEYDVPTVVCCRGLFTLVPVDGSYYERVNGIAFGPIGSFAATAMGIDSPPSSVRSRS